MLVSCLSVSNIIKQCYWSLLSWRDWWREQRYRGRWRERERETYRLCRSINQAVRSEAWLVGSKGYYVIALFCSSPFLNLIDRTKRRTPFLPISHHQSGGSSQLSMTSAQIWRTPGRNPGADHQAEKSLGREERRGGQISGAGDAYRNVRQGRETVSCEKKICVSLLCPRP